jgi:putative addiction module component (TIGR02574 family)
LSPADRLELIGVVWETLSADDLPVTDAERALLDARLADMERNPDDQSPWPEVKARLERLTRSVTKFKSVAPLNWISPRRKFGTKRSRLDWALSSVQKSQR